MEVIFSQMEQQPLEGLDNSDLDESIDLSEYPEAGNTSRPQLVPVIVFFAIVGVFAYFAHSASIVSGNMQSVTTLEETKKAVHPMLQAFTLWGKGKFDGPDCAQTIAPLLADGFKVTISEALADQPKEYFAAKGWCEWCKFLGVFDLSEYKPAFYETADESMIQVDASVPRLKSGKTATVKATPTVCFATSKNGKMTGLHFQVSAATLSLFDQTMPTTEVTPDMAPLMKAMRMWGKGEFHGPKCEANAATVVADAFQAVSNVAIPEAGIGEQYFGAKGNCQWAKIWDPFDMNASAFDPMYIPEGSGSIVQVNSWTPALANGVQSTHVIRDVCLTKTALGKITGFEYFWAQPQTMAHLFNPPESTYFLIKHTFKSSNDIGIKAWWKAIATDKDKKTLWFKAMAEKGFFNHYFMPTGINGPFYCLWEARAGNSKEDMQGFIDSDSLSPVSKHVFENLVMQISTTLTLLGRPPIEGPPAFEYDVIIRRLTTPASNLATPARVTGTMFYLVEHSFKSRDAVKPWWTNITKMNADAWKKFGAATKDAGFTNNLFLPTARAGPMYCLWEAAKDKTPADMQDFIDNNKVTPAPKGEFNNVVMSIPLKLIGGVLVDNSIAWMQPDKVK